MKQAPTTTDKLLDFAIMVAVLAVLALICFGGGHV